MMLRSRTHELVEYPGEMGVELGWLGECAYALDVPRSSPFHHKGGINSILAVMSGYAVSAEWTRM